MRKIRLDQDLWLFHGVADSPLARADLLRAHLAEGLGLAPSNVVIARDDQGKPTLVSPSVPLWFNMASRDGVASIATSRQGPVGVDVETLAHCRNVQGVAEQLFSTVEADWLAERPEPIRPLGFARLWTGKEAVLKAQGQGIAQGLTEPMLDYIVETIREIRVTISALIKNPLSPFLCPMSDRAMGAVE